MKTGLVTQGLRVSVSSPGTGEQGTFPLLSPRAMEDVIAFSWAFKAVVFSLNIPVRSFHRAGVNISFSSLKTFSKHVI